MMIKQLLLEKRNILRNILCNNLDYHKLNIKQIVSSYKLSLIRELNYRYLRKMYKRNACMMRMLIIFSNIYY